MQSWLKTLGVFSLVLEPPRARTTSNCLQSNSVKEQTWEISRDSSGFPTKPRWLCYCNQQPSSKPGWGRCMVLSKEEWTSAGKRTPRNTHLGSHFQARTCLQAMAKLSASSLPMEFANKWQDLCFWDWLCDTLLTLSLAQGGQATRNPGGRHALCDALDRKAATTKPSQVQGAGWYTPCSSQEGASVGIQLPCASQFLWWIHRR